MAFPPVPRLIRTSFLANDQRCSIGMHIVRSIPVENLWAVSSDLFGDGRNGGVSYLAMLAELGELERS